MYDGDGTGRRRRLPLLRHAIFEWVLRLHGRPALVSEAREADRLLDRVWIYGRRKNGAARRVRSRAVRSAYGCAQLPERRTASSDDGEQRHPARPGNVLSNLRLVGAALAPDRRFDSVLGHATDEHLDG